MQEQLDELTNKIYQEGVEKANKDAEEILTKARSEAERIVENSKKEAEKILKNAEEDSGKLKRNTEADLKLAGNQAISSLKLQIKELLSAKILNQPVGELIVNPDFLKEIILSITQNMNQNQGFEIKFSKEMEEKLDQAFENSLKKEIKDLKIDQDGKFAKGFRIEPKGDTFQLTFTEEDFINFFKPFLKEKTEKLIFSRD